MLENKKVKTIWGDVHYTRFIAAWNMSTGRGSFVRWLKSLQKRGLAKLTDENIREMDLMYMTGKLELDEDAKEFRINFGKK